MLEMSALKPSRSKFYNKTKKIQMGTKQGNIQFFVMSSVLPETKS